MRVKVPRLSDIPTPELEAWPFVSFSTTEETWRNGTNLIGSSKNKLNEGIYRCLYVIDVIGNLVTGLIGSGEYLTGTTRHMSKNHTHRYVAIHPTIPLPFQPPSIHTQEDDAFKDWHGFIEYAHPISFTYILVPDKKALIDKSEIQPNIVPGQRLVTTSDKDPRMSQTHHPITLSDLTHQTLLLLNHDYANGVCYDENNMKLIDAITAKESPSNDDEEDEKDKKKLDIHSKLTVQTTKTITTTTTQRSSQVAISYAAALTRKRVDTEESVIKDGKEYFVQTDEGASDDGVEDETMMDDEDFLLYEWEAGDEKYCMEQEDSHDDAFGDYLDIVFAH